MSSRIRLKFRAYDYHYHDHFHSHSHSHPLYCLYLSTRPQSCEIFRYYRYARFPNEAIPRDFLKKILIWKVGNNHRAQDIEMYWALRSTPPFNTLDKDRGSDNFCICLADHVGSTESVGITRLSCDQRVVYLSLSSLRLRNCSQARDLEASPSRLNFNGTIFCLHVTLQQIELSSPLPAMFPLFCGLF